MQEIWKTIDGYDYQISNQGRVKNSRGKILNPYVGKKGYARIGLFTKPAPGIRRDHNIHRLVAKAFISNPRQLPEVNHKNGIKRDNNASNIEWSTHAGNILHSYRTLKRKASGAGKFGIDNGRSKPVVMMDSAGRIVQEFESAQGAYRATGIHASKISLVCNGKRYKTGGFGWRFKEDV